MKHTKGEWKKMFSENIECFWINGNRQNIANINGGAPDDSIGREEAEANAKLIAAAPELLEACISLSKQIEMNDYQTSDGLHDLRMNKAVHDMTNAIKKATT